MPELRSAGDPVESIVWSQSAFASGLTDIRWVDIAGSRTKVARPDTPAQFTTQGDITSHRRFLALRNHHQR